MTFELKRRVAFYETDMMGVVHHSNYLKYFEDARLEWLASTEYLAEFSGSGGLQFAVVDASLSYKSPASYGDILKIQMKVRAEKAKLYFDYEIYCRQEQLVCTGSTVHVTVDADMRPHRVPNQILSLLEN